MFNSVRQTSIVSCFVLIATVSGLHVFASDPISFDVPAILPAYLVDVESSSTTDTVKLDVPVSLLVQDSNGIELEELMIAVYWTAAANPVCDFSPKTLLASDIAGTVAFQKSVDKSGNIGIDSNGSYGSAIGINGRMQLSGSNRETTSFSQLPEQNLLAASGHIKRGTGVYFKFRKSTQTTLEGTHELSICFKVPKVWRAGLMRVDCQVKGRRSSLGGFDSSQFSIGTEFVAAIHLDNDTIAFDLAKAYVEHENHLLGLRRQQPAKKSKSLLGQLEALVDSQPASTTEDWYRQVVYSSSEKAFQHLHRQLPRTLQAATSEFLSARKQLTSLHR